MEAAGLPHPSLSTLLACFSLFFVNLFAAAVFYHVPLKHGCSRLGQLPVCRGRHIWGCSLHRSFGSLGAHGTFCLQGYHLRDRDGTLAGGLLPTPVRPAWGQGFRWGVLFPAPVAKPTPRRNKGSAGLRRLMFCHDSRFSFFFWRGSVWNIILLCLLPGNDFPGDPQDVVWHMQKMQEARWVKPCTSTFPVLWPCVCLVLRNCCIVLLSGLSLAWYWGHVLGCHTDERCTAMTVSGLSVGIHLSYCLARGDVRNKCAVCDCLWTCVFYISRSRSLQLWNLWHRAGLSPGVRVL